MGSDAPQSAPQKSRITAALLCFFLGGFGIHKFYLGYTAIGITFLLVNTVGLAVTWLLLFIPNFLIGLINLIEFIIYLTKSDEEFHRIYVVGRRPLF